MGSRQAGLLLTVVMLVLVFDCGNSNVRRFEAAKSIRVKGSASILHHDSRYIHRFRRSVLNSSEMQEALDNHNRLRRLEGASNMEIMVWDNDLANQAEVSAEKCIWNHTNTGQNLYSSNSQPSINLTAAIQAWYNEKPYYSYWFSTGICQEPNGQCLHYSQVVWATSRKLGCAYTKCPTLQFSDLTNALLLVCNYDPPGNVKGQMPYLTGTACSACSSGSWRCNDELCDEGCTASGPPCACSPVCKNNGSVNGASCSCSCMPGWYGADCGVVCQDKDTQCNPQPGQTGYPPSYCSRSDYGPTVQKLCPKMCNLCQGIASSMKPSLLNMLSVWLSWLLIYSLRSI